MTTPAATSAPAPPSSDLPSAFTVGWLIAELHGPKTTAGRAAARGPLPTVNELGRADHIELALQQLDALLLQPLGAAVAPHGSDRPVSTTTLHNLGKAHPFDPAAFCAAVEQIHTDLLIRLTVADRRLGSAYILGRSLFDTCWLARTRADFVEKFNKYRLSNLQSWLGDLAGGLQPLSAAAVSQSLGHWAAWVEEVNDQATWDRYGPSVQRAARAQGEHWRALLAGDTSPKSLLTPEAFVEAGEAALRRAVTILRGIVVHFWAPLLIITLLTAVSVAIVLADAAGTARVWGSLVTLAAGFGVTAKSAQSTAKSLASEASAPLLQATQADAIGWAVTWLPDVPLTSQQAAALRKRGVAPPEVTKQAATAPPRTDPDADPDAPRPPPPAAPPRVPAPPVPAQPVPVPPSAPPQVATPEAATPQVATPTSAGAATDAEQRATP